MSKRLPQKKDTPELKRQKLPAIDPPSLLYLPQDPKSYRPAIGLIGCGGITKWHLTAYKRAGYQIVVLCDVDRTRAAERQKEFFPDADVTDDFLQVLTRDDVEVVDITTHPEQRPPLIEAALKAGKHVLSQKPFVTDLDVGQRLVDLADRQGVLLAVNQNGRWAPHFSYLRTAVEEKILGSLTAAHFQVHWNHGWVEGTEFENVRHLILYDFAIHWFDMLTCLMGNRDPKRIFASFTRSATQKVRPGLLGQALVEYEGAQATLVFDGDTRHGEWESTFVTGSEGSIRCEGPNYEQQKLSLTTSEGIAKPKLQGKWFPDGFHGTMGELLRAIEENRQPSHSAQNNLSSLALCFAAVASAEQGKPVVPGSVRKMP